MHKDVQKARTSKEAQRNVSTALFKLLRKPVKLIICSVHDLIDPVWCPFCWNMFNRDDNSRQHLTTHTTNSGRGDYHELAEWLYNEEKAKAKARRSRKNGAKVATPEPEEADIIRPIMPKLMRLADLPESLRKNYPTRIPPEKKTGGMKGGMNRTISTMISSC